MQDYCDTSYTPDRGWYQASRGAQVVAMDQATTHVFGYRTSPFSDPIGTSTDVSIYYTMSVTRSDAYSLAIPTASNGSVTFTSTRKSDRYIIPTASDSTTPREITISGGKDAASTTSSVDSGAGTRGPAGLLAIAVFAAIGL